jgi:hypothetical protein
VLSATVSYGSAVVGGKIRRVFTVEAPNPAFEPIPGFKGDATADPVVEPVLALTIGGTAPAADATAAPLDVLTITHTVPADAAYLNASQDNLKLVTLIAKGSKDFDIVGFTDLTGLTGSTEVTLPILP